MNYAHVHLLLNHIPILGSLFALGLFVASFFGKNLDFRRASYVMFVAVALLTIPTFLTGFGAKAMITGPGVSDALMTRHLGSALVSIWFMMLTGAFALVGLWQAQRQADHEPPHWNVIAVLILALMTAGLMARTGNTGGDIRHPEDRTEAEIKAGPNVVIEGPVSAILAKFEPDPQKFSDWMTFSKYWWTIMMIAHFLGLIMIVGTVGFLDLRIMGFLKQVPVAPVHRLLPVGLAGLGINVLTGLMAFAGRPDGFVFSIGLWIKMLGLMLLGVNAAVFYLTDIFGDVENLKAGEDATIPAKLVAASSLILWFVVIAMGRYIQPLTDTLLGSN